MPSRPLRSTFPDRCVPPSWSFNGGGWFVGDKWSWPLTVGQLAGDRLLRPQHQLTGWAPYSKFPAQVDDVREAILFLVDHAISTALIRRGSVWFGYSPADNLSALVRCDVPTKPPRSKHRRAIGRSTIRVGRGCPRWRRFVRAAAL